MIGPDTPRELHSCYFSYNRDRGTFSNGLVSVSYELDDTIDYVLTLRMRPIKVKLRLLASAGGAHRYVLVQRR